MTLNTFLFCLRVENQKADQSQNENLFIIRQIYDTERTMAELHKNAA